MINWSFENGWKTLPVTKNQRPNGWALTWREPGELLLAPKAGNGDTETRALCVPECVHKLAEQLPADEQLGGKDALILDGTTTYKVFGKSAFRATLAQQFDVVKGAKCRLVIPVQVHGHLNSDGVPMNIDTGAAYWRVTINGYPGKWYTYNNDFSDRTWWAPEKLFTAVYGVVDILIEFECHTIAGCDFFVDNIQFDVEDTQPQPVECRGKPRVQYERTYNLLPQNATLEQFLDVAREAYANRETIGFSADDAGIGDLDRRLVYVWWFTPDDWDTEAIENFFGDYYPGVNVVHVIDYDEPQPPTPTDFTPTNYVPIGTKIGFHCIGSAGQTDLYRQWVAMGCEPPSVKAVQDIGWLAEIKQIAPAIKTIGRFIDDGKGGGSLEWFDSNRDPIVQAQERMNALIPLWDKHRGYVDYWEIVNEQDPQGPEGHVKLAEFFIEAMRIAEAYGYRLALFSYSMGVPEPDEWDAIAGTGVFEKAAAGGHAISLHEYGVMPTDVGSLLGRYEVLTDILKERRLSIPVYITEYAPDAWDLGKALEVMRAFETRSRNVSYAEHAAAQFILTQPSRTKFSIADGMGIAMGTRISGVEAALMTFTDDALMGQVAAYDALTTQNPYIAGVHIFTVGGFGSWPQFDQRWIKLYPRFTQYFDSVKGRVNG